MPAKAGRSERPYRRLTPKQLRILTLIRDFQRKNGYSPTMQELADVLGVTKVTVFEHVSGLEKKGLLQRLRHRARSLELTSRAAFPDESPSVLPLVGHIAAGAPIEAIENHEGVDLEHLFASRSGAFALKVRGDSMIDEHIRDGDLVIAERRETAMNGETVVALLDSGEATLKKFYREKNRIRLQPANPAFSPIYVKDVQIQGVVIGVLRLCR
ncbi:MAG TPA: transcriptional repressor LexA [Phycisphaerae bacterium]|nr:transcriptional repressor LexA [Phycisphaerae bacterium]